MNDNQPRQPAGAPTGGQFATTGHAETSTTLAARPHQHETPRQVDEQLGALYREAGTLDAARASAVDYCHSLNGERATWVSRSRKKWPSTGAETVSTLREKVAAGTMTSWDQQSAVRTLEKIDGIDARLEELRAQNAELEDEFRGRGGWSRFFLVTSSDGHIHSTMGCHTCKPSTRYGWLPELSGKSEAEAVAEHGAILCTACYPSAPVEWTMGKAEDPDTCPGSNQHIDDARRVGRSRYGSCPVCGRDVQVTMSGIRKHKRPT